MRRLTSVLLATGLVPVAIALPTATSPAVPPHPVKPRVYTLPLAGVDAAALASAAAPGAPRPYALTRERATAPFTTVGVSWRHDPAVSAVTVSLRTRTDGRWTGWHAVTNEDDEPDPNSPDTRAATLRDGTAPVWTGHSDGIQVRVDKVTGRAPRDLRVDLIDPGTSAADATLGSTSAPPSAAGASASMPSYISRAQWGADESIRTGPPSYFDLVRMGFIHHTDTSNSYSLTDTAAQIRAVYAYHVLSRGWSDIGYNFLVDRYGRTFEGRYGGVTRPVLGAHTGGFNTGSFGVALLGTFGPGGSVPASYVPSATLGTVERLLAWKLGLGYRDPLGYTTLVSAGGGTSRYPAGTAHTFNNISGHRDAGFTSCPGDYAFAQLPNIRSAAVAATGAGLITPHVSTSRPYYLGAPVGVYAGLRRPVSWRVTVTDAAARVVRLLSGTASTSIATGWDLRSSTGAWVPPGLYSLRLDAAIPGNAAVPWTTGVIVQSPVPPNTAVVPTDDPTVRLVRDGLLRHTPPALMAAVRPPTWAFRVNRFTYSSMRAADPPLPAPQGLAGRDPATGAIRVADQGRVVTLTDAQAAALGYTNAAVPALSVSDFGLPVATGGLAAPNRHPDGTLVSAGGRTWMLYHGTRHLIDASFVASFGRRPVLAPVPGDATAAGTSLAPANGTLVRTEYGLIYNVEYGARRYIVPSVAYRLGIVGGWLTVPAQVLAAVTTPGAGIP